MLAGILVIAVGLCFFCQSASAAIAGDLLGYRLASSVFTNSYIIPNWSGFVFAALLWALGAMFTCEYVRTRQRKHDEDETTVTRHEDFPALDGDENRKGDHGTRRGSD